MRDNDSAYPAGKQPAKPSALSAPNPASPRLRRRDGRARCAGKAEGASMRLSPRSRAGQATSSRQPAKLYGISGNLPTPRAGPCPLFRSFEIPAVTLPGDARTTPGFLPGHRRNVAKAPSAPPAVRLVRTRPIDGRTGAGGGCRRLRKPVAPTVQ